MATYELHLSVGTSGDNKKTATCTISAGVLTSSANQDDSEVGVGDLITYDTSKECYIKAKISETQWEVTQGDGTDPSNESTPVTINSIEKPYTTASAMEADCTNVVGNSNWTAAGADIEVYGENYKKASPDIGLVIWLGMTTDATHQFIIRTPYDTSTQCNTNQRNNVTAGIDDSYHKFGKSSGNFFEQRTAYMQFIGLQFQLTSTSANSIMFSWASGLSIGETIIDKCILKADDNSGQLVRGFYPQASISGAHVFKIRNTIVYDTGSGINSQPMLLFDTGSSYYVYNCTVVNGRNGIQGAGTDTLTAKNCVVIDIIGFSFTTAGAFTDDCTNNAAEDGWAPGSNDITLTTDTITDYFDSNGDFQLDPTATYASELLLAGADLSSDGNMPFSDDIFGNSRPAGRWDVGAHQESVALAADSSIITPLLVRINSAI